jgi:FkbM family methyltransferase
MIQPNMMNNYIPLECELLQRIVNKDSVVLDIGANTGTYTLYLAHLAKHVYAFEPHPDNFKQLQENTKHLNNVLRYEAAISNRSDFRFLYTCPQDNGMNRLYPSKWCEGGEKIRVSTIKLDDAFLITENNKINFIKIDVEGWEYHVIKGMTKLIQRDMPIIMMEWHPPTLEEEGTDPKHFYDLMKDELGYGNPKHCMMPGYPVINTYAELEDYTRNIPAINIIFGY